MPDAGRVARGAPWRRLWRSGQGGMARAIRGVADAPPALCFQRGRLGQDELPQPRRRLSRHVSRTCARFGFEVERRQKRGCSLKSRP